MEVNTLTIADAMRKHVDHQAQPQDQASLPPFQNDINAEPPCELASSHANEYDPIRVQPVCSQLEQGSRLVKQTRRFKRRRLDSAETQVRLLYVWATSDGNIAGHLHHYELSSAPTYFALSYTWGSGTTQDILIDEKPVSVLPNLFTFLQTLVEKIRTGRTLQRSSICNISWFWIDQLCIDQDSLAEKNCQVGLMPEIYKRALQVIVWLGAEPEDCEGFRIIRALSNSRFGMPSTMETRQSRKYRRRPDDAEDRVSYHKYWERVWVVQEVKLAQQVRLWCGREELSRDEYMSSLERNWRRSDAYLSRFVLSDEGFDDITSACFYMVERLCKDPRDLIYGIQSLFKAEERFKVDYQKHRVDLFLEVATRVFGECSLTEHPRLNMHVMGLLWAFGVHMKVFRGCPKSHNNWPHLHGDFLLRQDCFTQVVLHPEILHLEELAAAISKWLPFKSRFILNELGNLLRQPQHAQNRLTYIEYLVEYLGRRHSVRHLGVQTIWRTAETYYPVRADGIHCEAFCGYCRSFPGGENSDVAQTLSKHPDSQAVTEA